MFNFLPFDFQPGLDFFYFIIIIIGCFFSQDAPVTGRKADVVTAAHLCSEAALRLVKPGSEVRCNLLLLLLLH